MIATHKMLDAGIGFFRRQVGGRGAQPDALRRRGPPQQGRPRSGRGHRARQGVRLRLRLRMRVHVSLSLSLSMSLSLSLCVCVVVVVVVVGGGHVPHTPSPLPAHARTHTHTRTRARAGTTLHHSITTVIMITTTHLHTPRLPPTDGVNRYVHKELPGVTIHTYSRQQSRLRNTI